MRTQDEELIRPARWLVVSSALAVAGLVVIGSVVQVRTVANGTVVDAPKAGAMTVEVSSAPLDGDVVDVAVQGGQGRAVVSSVTPGRQASVTLRDVTLDVDVAVGAAVQVRLPNRSLLRALVS